VNVTFIVGEATKNDAVNDTNEQTKRCFGFF